MSIGNWRVFTLIFDMQINPWRPSWIRKIIDFGTQPEECIKACQKENREDEMNIGDRRAFTSNFNMQISPWWLYWICKLADFRTQRG